MHLYLLLRTMSEEKMQLFVATTTFRRNLLELVAAGGSQVGRSGQVSRSRRQVGDCVILTKLFTVQTTPLSHICMYLFGTRLRF